MIRSRLRRPTSKSITTVLCPRIANPVEIAADDVVLPTPPLPDVTVTTFPKKTSPVSSADPAVDDIQSDTSRGPS